MSWKSPQVKDLTDRNTREPCCARGDIEFDKAFEVFRGEWLAGIERGFVGVDYAVIKVALPPCIDGTDYGIGGSNSLPLTIVKFAVAP